jgi:hypothetical protein
MGETVSEKTCQAIHKGIDEKFGNTGDTLRDHDTRINSVEDAVLKLTVLVDSLGKKSIFDKIMTVSVFIIAVVLLALILGPEYVGKVLGAVK